MSHIVKLSIQNFRGIKDFEQTFPEDKKFVCLVGRGDCGKTTILDAIASVLSPAWNLTFLDTDFYNCDLTKNIQIEATLIKFPEELLSEEKYGLWQRGYCPCNNLISDELSDDNLPTLSIRLTVEKNLEPRWEVVNCRQQKNKLISAKDRAKLNCFMVSDYVDRHFYWNQGNPLHSLLKSNNKSLDMGDDTTVMDIVRKAKEEIDTSKNVNLVLDETTQKVIEQAASLGIDIEKSRTSIDLRDMLIREERVSLHDEKIPFRLKGKGTKRLISIAIQMLLVKQGGMMLVDEIEQGLEPDRIKLLARELKNHDIGQIFITTHSRDVITEIEASDIIVILRNKESGLTKSVPCKYDTDALQKVVRACPEAFFAEKIIVCEGATEIGICRALDGFRQKQDKALMSFKNCAYIDGTGSCFISRAKSLKEVGFNVAVLCDSDIDIKTSKTEMVDTGINIFDCEDNNAIEQQVFKDLPWKAVIELIKYAKFTHYNDNDESINSAIESKHNGALPSSWRDDDSLEMRKAIADASVVRGKEWFKRIDHGEKLGQIIFSYFSEMKLEKLKLIFEKLSAWVDDA